MCDTCNTYNVTIIIHIVLYYTCTRVVIPFPSPLPREALKPSTMRELRRQLPTTSLYNAYGPTETSDYCTSLYCCLTDPHQAPTPSTFIPPTCTSWYFDILILCVWNFLYKLDIFLNIYKYNTFTYNCIYFGYFCMISSSVTSLWNKRTQKVS